MAKGRSNKTGRNLGGRKPVSLVAASGYATVWEQVWAAVRARAKRFTSADIAFDTKASEGTVASYIKRLAAAGYVQALERNPRCQQGGAQFRYADYRLVNDVGVRAPRVNGSGQAVTAGLTLEKLWTAARILREFDALELHAASSAKERPIRPGYARKYVEALARAGYLVLSRPAKKGKGGTLARWRFVPAMNTGPKPPMVQRSRAVFDPNLNRVIWQP